MDSIQRKSFRTYSELQAHIKSAIPSLFVASKTSTVIPYEFLEEKLALYGSEKCVVELSTIPGEINVNQEKETVEVSGHITWKELKAECLSLGLEVMTSPTEELANVLSGVATSCTGERCFGLGTMRDQIEKVQYFGHDGELKQLGSDKELNLDIDLKKYQTDYKPFENFKNAPFPRLDKEIDLMIGTEGQLGIIKSVELRIRKKENIRYVFIRLPKWEEDFSIHLNIYKKIQRFRGEIIACELIDSNSLSYLPKDKRPFENQDLIFLEILDNSFEYVYEEFLTKLGVNENQFFEIAFNKCRELRMDVPRYIFEKNAQMGVQKKGTDVQATGENFENLLNTYKEWSKDKIKYNLFGHFGDGHLHFNFMPTVDELPYCNTILENFYINISKLNVSPFAEHGIGLLKRDYIKNYWTKNQYNVFKEIKNIYDPSRIFFPSGYMGIKSD